MAPLAESSADRRVNIATAGLFAAVAIVILATFRDYGITWDEELHIPYGDMLLSYYVSGFKDLTAFGFVNLFMYGGFFDLMASICNLVSPFGVEETRHLLGGAVLLAGLLAGWRLARLLAGDRAALIAVACLATTPLLYGHSFINPKDAPFGWLALWVAYYCCRAFAEGSSISRRTIIGLGISLGLALGSRIIAVALICQIGVVLVLWLWARFRSAGAWNTRQVWPVARSFAAALPIAFVLMAVFWPWSVQSPFNVLGALREFSQLYWHPEMLWNGEIIKADDLPRSYLVVLLAVQLPEYVLAGVTFLALGTIIRARSWSWAMFTEPKTLQYLYVVLTVAVPLTAFVVLRPITYNGVRHFLFVVPQLVVLAAIGLEWALRAAERQRAVLAKVLGAVLFLAVGRQVFIMADVHPYQYLLFNSLTGDVAGAYGRFELDYWGESYAEATRQLVAFVQKERGAAPAPSEKLKVYVCGGNLSVGYYLPESITITEDVATADFYVAGDISNPRCSHNNVAPRPPIVEVKRRGALLSYVLDLRHAVP